VSGAAAPKRRRAGPPFGADRTPPSKRIRVFEDAQYRTR
jgi:hypothetical protein